jgi:CPA2 family monovalent cation:H+ antiporter-2
MSILTGQKVKDAIQTGFGLAQIGEFAYMMALLYMTTTGDVNHPMYQIVVAVSLLTTCLNPVMLRISDPVGTWVENHIPGRITGWLSAYSDWLMRYRTSVVPSRLQRHIRTRLAWLFIIGILNVCVSVAVTMLADLDYSSFSVFFNKHKEVFFCLVALLFCLGMMFAPLTMLARSLGRDIAMVISGRRTLRKWQNAVRTIVTWFVTSAVYVVALVQVFMLTVHLIPNEKELRIILIASFVLIVILCMKYFGKSAKKAGYGFQEALAAERRHLQKLKMKKDIILSVPDDFYVKLTIDKNSLAIGKTIKNLDIRAKTGASVVSVERNGVNYRNPGPDWQFSEGDIAGVIGESTQIASFKKMFNVSS